MFALALFGLLTTGVFALNFDWEHDQLTNAEVAGNKALHFGSDTAIKAPDDGCKVVPGDAGWPSDKDWAAFNQTLGGALLKPRPLASVCYAGSEYNAAQCSDLKDSWAGMSLYTDDPTSVMSQWASGNSCPPTLQPNWTCTQGGWPTYVVRATSIRHIQLAVNFARNNYIRLVIKNSGHDFNGKSIGGHSLSVWTHNLKKATYNADYTSPDRSYNGRAVAYSAGFQAFEGSALMRKYNMTMIVAGGGTVGIAGGFLQGGGHSTYTSYFGLAADQIQEITAVTADGRVVEMNAGKNTNLFWAFRGGGGGTYSIITSVVVKVFPNTPVTSGSITFSTKPAKGSNSSISTETFWNGMRAYWEYGNAICDAGGLGYNFIYPNSTATGLTFTVSISMPDISLAEYRAFVRPLAEKLNALGIPQSMPVLKRSYVSALDNKSPLHRRALGEMTGHTLIASRFFKRNNFNTSARLEEAHLAIRHLVEDGGLTFHGMSYSPTLAVAGNPRNAVNPAFRTTVLHAQGYEPNAHWDGSAPMLSQADLTVRHNRLQSYMQKWRDVTAGSGSYINEGDAQDWAWKEAFFGSNYARLASIKQQYDPEGVFWAVGAVGHDGWEMRDVKGGKRKGIITQDGRLCRVSG